MCCWAPSPATRALDTQPSPSRAVSWRCASWLCEDSVAAVSTASAFVSEPCASCESTELKRSPRFATVAAKPAATSVPNWAGEAPVRSNVVRAGS
eukprot:6308914-Prymnesium_polylepis.3